MTPRAHQRAVDRHHDAAALADDADRAALERGDAVVRNGHHPRWRREIAHAVRARHRDAGAVDRALEVGRERAPLRVAAFAEAAGEHGRAARLGLAGLRDGLDRGGARHDHHHVVGRLRQVAQARVAGLAVPDRLVARIDRIDRAGKLELLERAIDALRPVAGPVAGADDRDVARIEQGAHARDALLGVRFLASVSRPCLQMFVLRAARKVSRAGRGTRGAHRIGR